MFLALDVGTKTIGVATSSGAMPVATAWFTLRREGVKKDVSRLVSAVEGEAWSVDQVVVGLPLEMDDAERRICRLARQVGDRLAAETGWPVHYQDERWTTIEARRRLETRGISGRRQKETIDAEAAAVILEDWLRTGARTDA
ncbi:MAG: Holliday junction resolvase RuvX [Myxococcota bacterium]|nr:Holliday junction resolvase RuvX [Myxococcota bacterium]